MVDSPTLAWETAERMLECEFTLGAPLQVLTRDAEEAGWARDEIALALMILSKSYMNTSRPLGSRYNRSFARQESLIGN